MRQLLFIIIPLILTGCGESAHVKNVKSLVYDDIDSSITVGNALSHRAICQRINWSTFKDDRNREIVEYTCDLELDEANAFLSEEFNGSIALLNDKEISETLTINENGMRILSSELTQQQYAKNNPDAYITKFIKINATDYLIAGFYEDKYKQYDDYFSNIANSALFHQYQTYKKYFVDNQQHIEQALNLYEDNYFGLSQPYQKLYGLSPYRNESITSVKNLSNAFNDYTFWVNLVHRLSNKDAELKNNVQGLLDVIDKLKREYFNSINDKNIEQAYLKLFDSSYRPLFYKNPNRNEGVPVYVNDYRDYLHYISLEYHGIMDTIYQKVIKPYNESIAHEIFDVVDLKMKNKIRRYQQKIQWSVFDTKKPALIQCQLFINDKLVSTVDSHECFQAAFSEAYISHFYNKPLINMHFMLMYNQHNQ